MADAYDDARPGHPDELWDAVVATTGIGRGSRVLEVGCGTGQATCRLVELGCEVDAVELGPSLAAATRRNCPTATVHVADFETIELDLPPLDAVVSALAWHWLDPRVSYAKAARLLRRGGWLVLITTIPVGGGTEDALMEDISRIHRRWSLPDPAEVEAWATGGGDIAAVWSRVERAFEAPPRVTDFYERPLLRTCRSSLTYEPDQWIRLIESQSAFALLPGDEGRRVLTGLRSLVDGPVVKRYVGVVAMAMRR